MPNTNKKKSKRERRDKESTSETYTQHTLYGLWPLCKFQMPTVEPVMNQSDLISTARILNLTSVPLGITITNEWLGW